MRRRYEHVQRHPYQRRQLPSTLGRQYPASSPTGCGTVSACSSSEPSLYAQLQAAGLGWNDFVEGATSACPQTSIADVTKIGHDPGLFYPAANCAANVLPVTSLTTPDSGAFWTDLANNTLPAFTWLSPNQTHNGEETPTLANQDKFMSSFLPQFVSSAAYQSGTTALIVTDDEGTGSDATPGEDCTNKTLDVGGKQPSCQVPLWVVYPYNPGTKDATFLDLYSVTKAVDDLFGLPEIGHAADAQTASLLGHFGLTKTTAAPPSPPPSATPTPTPSVTSTPVATDLFAAADPSVESSAANFVGLYNSTSSPTWSSSTAHTGTHSITVTNSTATTANVGLNYKGPTIKTVKGTVYTASAWVRTPTPNATVSVLLSASSDRLGPTA